MQIYVYRDGLRHGPYSVEEVTQYVRDGRIIPNDLAWYEGCKVWTPVSALPGLKLPSLMPSLPSLQPAEPIFTPPLGFPPQVIETQGKSEIIGLVALLLPLAGALLNIFLVGNMQGLSLFMIAIGVVVGSAVLIGYEAHQLGMDGPEDPLKTLKVSTSPSAWASNVILLWFFMFPAYFAVRSNYGVKKRVVPAILLTLLFISSIVINLPIIEHKNIGIQKNVETRTSYATVEEAVQVADSEKSLASGDLIKTNKFEIQILSVVTKKEVGDSFMKTNPSKGGIYLAVRWNYKNISKKPIGMFSHPNLSLIAPDGTQYHEDLGAGLAYGSQTNSGDDEKVLSDLNPGIKVNASAVFEVSREAIKDTSKWTLLIAADTEMRVKLDK